VEGQQRKLTLGTFAQSRSFNKTGRTARIAGRAIVKGLNQLNVGDAEMTTDNPQVPWTDEQWARVNQVIQEEARRARVAATFLPLIGPLPGDTDFVRRERITYPLAPPGAPPPPNRIAIDDRNIWQLATLQVGVRVRGAQMADPDMTSVLAMFSRAANVLARLEDAVVFRGLVQPGGPGTPVWPPGGAPGPGRIWEIIGGEAMFGLWRIPWLLPPTRLVRIAWLPPFGRDTRLVRGIAEAIGRLEAGGHLGPFAVVLDRELFLIAETPSPSLVLPQDRIIPFLGGGPLLRSSTLDIPGTLKGVVVALGGAPVELVIATDVCLQFLQLTTEPAFVFRLCEKMVLRIKEPEAIMQLLMY
jgi:uncharacterized linocin/CFP29 family protein